MKINVDMIEKVLNDRATPEEAKKVAAWFSCEEGNDFLSRYITDELENLTEEKALSWLNHEVPKQRMKARFLSQIKESRQKTLRRRLLMVAVMIPFLFLGVSFVFLAGRAGIFSRTEYVEVVVPCGERMRVILQDGTAVLLNSNSRLRYPRRFSLFNRTVELSGEGYFEVTKMKIAPFVVDLNGLNVEVKGTKFNVKAYADDQSVWVTLEEGRVQVADGKHLEYTLAPREQVEYDRFSGQCKIRRMEHMETVSAWRSNSLNFYLTPLKEVLKVLERQYDIRFVVKDSVLLKSRFTLSTAKVNVADVLKELQKVSHILFEETAEGTYEVMQE